MPSKTHAPTKSVNKRCSLCGRFPSSARHVPAARVRYPRHNPPKTFTTINGKYELKNKPFIELPTTPTKAAHHGPSKIAASAVPDMSKKIRFWFNTVELR